MGGHCSGSPDRATPCSTATPHTTLKRLQFPLNGSKYRTIQSQQRCDILANSVSCKRCQSSISIPFFLPLQFLFVHSVYGNVRWSRPLKAIGEKLFHLAGNFAAKFCSVVNGKAHWKYVAIRSVANVALNLLHLQWHFGATCPDCFISQISLEYFTSSASFVPVSLRGVYVMQTH